MQPIDPQPPANNPSPVPAPAPEVALSSDITASAPGEQLVCCVCGTDVNPPYHIIGKRVYCDRHFALVNKRHPGFWRSAIVQIVGLGLFSGLIALVAPYIEPLSGAWLVGVGILLVLVPTVLWAYYFYRQDRLEPEPKTRILQVILLAMLLTEGIGYKVVTEWLHVGQWGSSFSWIPTVASILVAGFTWQAITYITVRAVVYTTTEFDERMDGIVYGTMAGLGVATVLNLHYVLDNSGVALGPGVVHIVTAVLAQAAFSGLVGYFMAQAKFEHRPVWWVPGGLALAAVLNGLFLWLINEVSADGLTVAPWRSLILGLIMALAAFTALLALMRQAEGSAAAVPPVS